MCSLTDNLKHFHNNPITAVKRTQIPKPNMNVLLCLIMLQNDVFCCFQTPVKVSSVVATIKLC